MIYLDKTGADIMYQILHRHDTIIVHILINMSVLNVQIHNLQYLKDLGSWLNWEVNLRPVAMGIAYTGW